MPLLIDNVSLTQPTNDGTNRTGAPDADADAGEYDFDAEVDDLTLPLTLPLTADDLTADDLTI